MNSTHCYRHHFFVSTAICLPMIRIGKKRAIKNKNVDMNNRFCLREQFINHDKICVINGNKYVPLLLYFSWALISVYHLIFIFFFICNTISSSNAHFSTNDWYCHCHYFVLRNIHLNLQLRDDFFYHTQRDQTKQKQLS